MRDTRGTHGYGYDAVGRLTSVDYPTGFPIRDEGFIYNASGNRISSFFSYDFADRLQSGNGWNYTYDHEGRTTARTSSFVAMPAFAWDAEGRLRKATAPDGSATTYRYDPLGRRIEKAGPAGTKRYGYGLDHNALVESDAQGPVASYTFGEGLDSPLAMERGAATSYYQQGGLSNVTSLSRADGSVSNRFAYGAFGTPAAGDFAASPHTFTGREWDPESNTYHFRARQMDPGTGRFLSEDPVWAPNLYPYADNDPVSLNDPLGLAPSNLNEANAGIGVQASLRFQIGMGTVIGFASPFLCSGSDVDWREVAFSTGAGALGGWISGRAVPLLARGLGWLSRGRVDKPLAMVIGNAISGSGVFALTALAHEALSGGGLSVDKTMTALAGMLSGQGAGVVALGGSEYVSGPLSGALVELFGTLFREISGEC